MHPIEEVERQYEQVKPMAVSLYERMYARANLVFDFPVQEIRIWLEGPVVRLIATYLAYPAFQSLAAWPLRDLAGGSETPAGSILAKAEEALITAAVALRDVAGHPRIKPHLLRTDSRHGASTTSGILPPSLITQVDMVASRPWTGFVLPEDYFNPYEDLLLKDLDPLWIPEAAMNPMLNHELPLIGDFVSRYALKRLDIHRTRLEPLRRIYGQAVLMADEKDLPEVKAESQAWSYLENLLNQLRTSCLLSMEAALREDIIILTQVFATYHHDPRPELHWLGMADDLIGRGVRHLRSGVPTWRRVEVTDRIAKAIRTLRQLGDSSLVGRPEVQLAINAGGLVLTKQPHGVYWEAQRLEVDWDRKRCVWEFLLRLAEKARMGASVSERDLYAGSVSYSTMANRKLVLANCLPKSLKEKIVPVRPQAYKLDLLRSQVHIFDAK